MSKVQKIVGFLLCGLSIIAISGCSININCREIDDGQAREIEDLFIMELEEDGLTNYRVLDSSEVTDEVLQNRNGVVIIERCFAILTDDDGNARLLNPAYPDRWYISYKWSSEPNLKKGTVLVSYMVYNPETSYTDDITERYDFILTRAFEG